jgi:hypothetical protein
VEDIFPSNLELCGYLRIYITNSDKAFVLLMLEGIQDHLQIHDTKSSEMRWDAPMEVDSKSMILF